MALLLGVDVGTTSVKAGVFDATTARLSPSPARSTGSTTPAPDRAELDPETYWRRPRSARPARPCATAGADAAATSPRSPSRARARPSSRSTATAARSGRPSSGSTTGPRAEARELGRALRRRGRLRRRPASRRSTRPGRPASSCGGGATSRRCSTPRARFLLVEDFLLHRLTGRFVTEGGVQCTSLLYDIRRRRLVGRRCSTSLGHRRRDGCPSSRRPGERRSGRSGRMPRTRSACRRDRPVVAGGMDQGAGAVGVGNVGPGIVSESTGGALTLQASVDRHGGDPSRQTPVYVHSAPGPLPVLPGLPDRRDGPDLVPRPVRRRGGRSRRPPRAGTPTTC